MQTVPLLRWLSQDGPLLVYHGESTRFLAHFVQSPPPL